MDTFDTLVTGHLVAELLQPDRLRATLFSLWVLRAEKAAQVDGRVSALRSEVTSAEDKLKRLYRMVGDGVTDIDEILKERLATLKEERDRDKATLNRIQVAERAPAYIAPELIERFGHMMRENATMGEIPFRKAWLQSIVDRVEFGADVIRIVGDKTGLQNAITGSSLTAAPGARSPVRKWRASTPRFRTSCSRHWPSGTPSLSTGPSMGRCRHVPKRRFSHNRSANGEAAPPGT